MSAKGTAGIMTALQTGWHWWRGEIAALLPQGIRAALTSGVSIVAIDLEADAVVLRHFSDGAAREIARLSYEDFDAAHLRTALASRLSGPRLLRDSFALRLPDTAALRRNLSLPLAARRNLASLLDIELERQSPLDRSEIYHDYRVLKIDRAAGRFDIVWRIVRRASVAPALEICRKAGIGLAIVAFIGDETPPDGGNFPVNARAAWLLRARQWLVRGLLLLVVALLIAVAAGAYARNQSAIDAFTAHVEETRLAARGAMHLQREIDAERTRDTHLLRERQQLTVTHILAETTRLLPGGSWLTDFAYRDGEVRIKGTSGAASSLIAIFDASPLFAAAEFRAPLTQGPGSEQEQFDLAFKIRKGAR